MAVTYGTDAASLLKACGVELTEGIGVKLKHDGMEFAYPGGSDEPTFVPMKMSAVKKLVSTDISPQLKMTYQQLFTHAANKCCKGAGVSGVQIDVEHSQAAPAIPAKVSGTPIDETVQGAIKKAKTPILMSESSGKLGKGKAVPLKLANEMYQPVKGTGDASVYWCVGASPVDDVRVAARWLGDSLSMRVEGDFSEEVKAILAEIGLKACGGGHWSLHVKIPSDNLVLARKTAASVLMGLGVDWDTKFPNMVLIQGKGV